MKKTLTALVAIVLMLSLSVTVFADEAATEEPSDVIELQAFLYDDWGDAINNTLQKDSQGTAFAIALKPLDEVNAADTWYDFEVTIPGDCKKIDLVLNCAAKGDNRWMDITFNGELYHVNCLNTADWGIFYENTITIENVKKGDYVLRVACPADFDNETIKTPNIDYIWFNMFYEDYETVPEKEPETEAPAETDAPETDPVTDAPADEPDVTTAPETEAPAEEKSGCGSAMGAAAVVIALVSTLGTALIRRK